MITLEVFGHEPAPWCVPDVTRRGAIDRRKDKNKSYWRMKAWQDAVRLKANQAGQYIDGPVVIRADFYLPMPSSWPQWKKNAALSGEIAHTQTPDGTNLFKALEDSLKDVLFADDSYVSALSVSKTWVADVSQAGVSATVAPHIGMPSQVSRRADMVADTGWQPGIECEHGYDACPICDAKEAAE